MARVVEDDALQRLVDADGGQGNGSRWDSDVGDGVFGEGERVAAVFRIEATKVLAFNKEPHAQTRYRFT